MAIAKKWGTVAVIVAVGVLFSLLSPYFLTVSSFNNILFSMVVSCLVAIGLTYVISVGSFDLSVGMVVTTGSIVTALCIPILGPIGGILAALAAGVCVGLINGFLVTYARLSGIVTTLGVMFVLGGVNQFLTSGYQVPVDYSEAGFLFLGQGRLGFVAMPVVILIVVAVLAYLLSTKTRVGHYIEAVGDNPVASYYSGIRVTKWVIVSFVLSAAFAAMGGVLLTSISSSAQPVGGEGYLLSSFAAIYLGSTILGKGKPHILGTVLGVFFLFMVSSGMSMVGIPFAARQLFNGIVLIVAVGTNALLNREELHLKFI
nr:ABC transporter permease [uncultured Devosia sp.]